MSTHRISIPAAFSSDGPVARAWIIAAALPRASRDSVIAACVKLGIPYGIASAQVQRQRYGRRLAVRARQLSKSVRKMLARAAA